MLVLGIGIGLCMQVLTIIVQNTVRLSRPRGGDLRGDVLPHAGQLVRRGHLRHDLRQRAQQHAAGALAAAPASTPGSSRRPRRCTRYPADQIAPIVDAYAHAIHVVFLAAVPVAGVALRALRCSSRRSRCGNVARAGAATSATGSACPRARTARSSCRSPSPGCSAAGAALAWPQHPRRVRHGARRRRRLVRRPGARAGPARRGHEPRGDRRARTRSGAGPASRRSRSPATTATSVASDDELRLTDAGRARDRQAGRDDSRVAGRASWRTGAPPTTSCSRPHC